MIFKCDDGTMKLWDYVMYIHTLGDAYIDLFIEEGTYIHEYSVNIEYDYGDDKVDTYVGIDILRKKLYAKIMMAFEDIISECSLDFYVRTITF